MAPTREVPGKGVRLKRYKCTCGHVEDRAETGRLEAAVTALPAGMEELLDERMASGA